MNGLAHVFKPFLWPAVLVLAVTLLYGQHLHSPPVFDDLLELSVDEEGQQPIDNVRLSLYQPRALAMVTLRWTKAIFGLALPPFRVGNLLLHAAVAVALYAWVLQLLRVAASTPGPLLPPRGDRPIERDLAGAAALLFAVHPLAVYATGYLIQRTILMATLFALLALYTYAHNTLAQRPARLWWCVPLYYLAVLSKEVAIMLPALLVASGVWLPGDRRDRMRQQWPVFAVMGLVALGAVSTRWSYLGAAYEPDAGRLLGGPEVPHAYLYSVVTQCGLFFKYLGLWLAPLTDWTSVDMREPLVRHLWSPRLLGVAAYLAWGAAGAGLLWRRGARGLVGLAMLVPWCLFWTELVSVRVQEPFVLYRSYLWCFGLFVGMPLVLVRLRRGAFWVLLLVVAAEGALLSTERLLTFSHPVLLWTEAQKLIAGQPDAPDHFRIYFNLGLAQLQAGDFKNHFANMAHASRIDPQSAWAHYWLGYSHQASDRHEQALSEFDQAIALRNAAGDGRVARFYVSRARANEALGRVQAAEQDYVEACRLNPRVCRNPKDGAKPANSSRMPSQ